MTWSPCQAHPRSYLTSSAEVYDVGYGLMRDVPYQTIRKPDEGIGW